MLLSRRSPPLGIQSPFWRDWFSRPFALPPVMSSSVGALEPTAPPSSYRVNEKSLLCARRSGSGGLYAACSWI